MISRSSRTVLRVEFDAFLRVGVSVGTEIVSGESLSKLRVSVMLTRCLLRAGSLAMKALSSITTSDSGFGEKSLTRVWLIPRNRLRDAHTEEGCLEPGLYREVEFSVYC